jgi:hypothetical protein
MRYSWLATNKRIVLAISAGAIVFETERSREAFVGTSIFVRPQQKEEGDARHVCNCLLNMSTSWSVGVVENALED